jgi:hypothetical protein
MPTTLKASFGSPKDGKWSDALRIEGPIEGVSIIGNTIHIIRDGDVVQVGSVVTDKDGVCCFTSPEVNNRKHFTRLSISIAPCACNQTHQHEAQNGKTPVPETRRHVPEPQGQSRGSDTRCMERLTPLPKRHLPGQQQLPIGDPRNDTDAACGSRMGG